MNYLGHAFLSPNNAEVLTGNMMGDYVKGRKALEKFPEGIVKGLLLHRFIDEYVDTHPATLRAKVFFRGDYGLYSGAIMDTLYDHFLANDPRYFSSADELKSFSLDVYSKLDQCNEWFVDPFAAMFPHMREHNWLFGYRVIKGMERSLKGLERRAKYMPPSERAYTIFVESYYQLNQCYFEMIDDLLKNVRSRFD